MTKIYIDMKENKYRKYLMYYFKSMKKSSFLIQLLLTITLSSCSNFFSKNEELPVDEDDKYLGEPIINFTDSSEAEGLYEVRHGYSNGGDFISYWNRDNVTYNDGYAGLSLYDADKNYGSEIRTHQGYLYGYFGAKMKTFKKSGTVQSIFTYNGGEYQHDEIDIEFLGKDTTKVQFNYFLDGDGSHSHLHSLGFDSSLDFHDYGFKWEKEKITWYVDFKPVYSVKASLPTWGFIFINVWAGNNSKTEGWLGKYTPTQEKLTAYYDYISYKAVPESD